MFWIYAAGAALAAAGLADCLLIAYHFQHAGTVSATPTPVFYAVAMAVSGGSLVLGRVLVRARMGELIRWLRSRPLRTAGVPRRILACSGPGFAIGPGHRGA